jgi:glycosyltransferase involved in cell wall biosynthesis
MKFAFVSTMQGSPWGGSEELWSQAAARLKGAGHDVQAAVVYWPQLSDKITVLAQHGIRLETHSSRQAGRTRRIWNKVSRDDWRSYRRLKRFNPDLVVISQGHNQGGFDWTRVCREAAIPYVIIVHCNSDHWWFQEQTGEAVPSYTSARRIFCVSRGNLDLLRLQVGDPLLNAEVVWNPYNISSESTLVWPDESGKWRFACVARIDVAAKGQDLLLQALARPEWRDRTVELNLFGAGPDELALRRMTRMLQLNNVHFHGHVSDIRAIWEQNHLLVLPSRYEGLPLALVEAMWCGRPAVVTDVGGNAELCLDGETGFVASAATVSSFTRALERAWQRRKEWPNLGHAARARAESQIPRDPVAMFCERLTACAARSAEALADDPKRKAVTEAGWDSRT